MSTFAKKHRYTLGRLMVWIALLAVLLGLFYRPASWYLSNYWMHLVAPTTYMFNWMINTKKLVVPHSRYDGWAEMSDLFGCVIAFVIFVALVVTIVLIFRKLFELTKYQ